MECLTVKKKRNHFALKAKLYGKAIKTAFEEFKDSHSPSLPTSAVAESQLGWYSPCFLSSTLPPAGLERTMSSITTDILIIGAGPGGLACAKVLAEQGRQVLVLDRKKEIGPKVCAGGITWSGLVQHLPEDLLERSFSCQHLFSNCQKVVLQEKNPLVATVSREALGQWMAAQARHAGAEILSNTQVKSIRGLKVLADTEDYELLDITCSQLVGADGANSLVRRSLGLTTRERGLGINFQLAGSSEKMEWHLNTRSFGCGYGWVFPHRRSTSVGAYSPLNNMSAGRLKKNLLRWASAQGYKLLDLPCHAAIINYDYQGYAFGSTWLVGDAAGLASGLTGEGIYPAVISGENVARRILDPQASEADILALVKKQAQHHRVLRLAERNPFLCPLLMEMLLLGLRFQCIKFHALEMAPAVPSFLRKPTHD
jgi:geranylgeranyl reductase